MSAGQAQEQPCTKRTILASVLNRGGYPVPGLEAANFRAEFRGKPVRALSVAHEDQPRRIVILLDASGSMMRNTKKASERPVSIAAHITQNAPAGSNVSLRVFAKGIKDGVDFAAGRQAVLQKLEEVRQARGTTAYGAGLTALNDAILEAVKVLGPSSEGDVIYAITDGGDNASRSSRRDVEIALLGAHVRLFAFVLASPGRTPEEMNGPSTMREFAQASGGNLAYAGPLGVEVDNEHSQPADDPAAVDVALRRLYRQMIEIYRVEIELAEPADKLRDWKLELVDGPTVNKKNLRLLYPRKLMPCDADVSPH